MPAMCTFQFRGQGFYCIHNNSSAKQIKDRSSSVAITITEGAATTREVELGFNTARLIAPNHYVVRFLMCMKLKTLFTLSE